MLTVMIGIHKDDKCKLDDYIKRIDDITKHYDIDNDKVGSKTQGMIVTIPEIIIILLEKFDNSDEFEKAYLDSVVDISVSDSMYTYFAECVMDNTEYETYKDESTIDYMTRIIEIEIRKKVEETMSYNYDPTKTLKKYDNEQEYKEAVNKVANYASTAPVEEKKTGEILYTITMTIDPAKYKKHKSKVDEFVDKMLKKKGVKSITTTISYVE